MVKTFCKLQSAANSCPGLTYCFSHQFTGNRTNPNLDDLHLAFQDTGVVLNELENYVAQVDPVQFIHPFTAYPRCKPCRLQHPSCGEFVDRAEFYSDHLPPLPTIIHEEPKGSVLLLYITYLTI